MRQHESDGKRERPFQYARPLPNTELIQVIYSCGSNVLVVNLIRALTGAGFLKTYPRWPGRPRQHTVIYSLIARMIGAVITHRALHVAMQLVRADRVHPTDEDRAIASGSHRMRERWNPRIESVAVCPRSVFVWMPAGQH